MVDDTADTPAPSFATPKPAANGQTVTLRVITHPYGGFDPSEPGVPVITAEGTEVPAAQADGLIAKAFEHGVSVEKVTG